MIYDELIGEIYWVIGKIQSDPELEEELYRLNFDISQIRNWKKNCTGSILIFEKMG